MQETLKLNITSDPANLAEVRRAVESLCRQHGFDDASIDDVGLCVNEALANVIRHAYDGAIDRPIEVSVDCDQRAVTVRIRDWGNGIDPSAKPIAPKDPLKPGGLGLICLRKMMDSTEFLPQNDGMLLIMSRLKNRGSSEPLSTP
jgi:serine/threonine-protein kinase RsbW